MSKQIPLTQGLFAVVDDEDYEMLMQHKWQARYKKNGNSFYASRQVMVNKQVETIYMHTVIVGDSTGDEVDHANHNTLWNTRDNLRPCSHSENKANTGLRYDNVSGYKGVSWCSERRKWKAQIEVNQRNIFLGRHVTPELAALSYDTAAKRYFGEFAMTNAMLGLLEA